MYCNLLKPIQKFISSKQCDGMIIDNNSSRNKYPPNDTTIITKLLRLIQSKQ